ncbi:putative allantoin permease [Shouchella clausii]|nr:putative allantoin permease [Shouchella clausii]
MEFNKGILKVKPDPSLHNADLAPVSGAKKGWTWWSYSAIWMGIVHNLVAWQVAAHLMAVGLSFWQALLCILVAYAVAFIAILFNSYSGAKYGVPFPVLIRAAFGTKGAHLPVFIRAVLGVFWFGVHMYLGSMAVNAILGASFSFWESLGEYRLLGMGLNSFIAYVITWILHAYIITHDIERVRKFENWAGPLVMIVGLGLVWWAIEQANGLGNLVSIPSTVSGTKFWITFFLGMSALLGTVATLILNISDLTRFSRSQKDHMVGQGIGMPLMFVLFSVMALLTTAGTMIAFGEAITNPIDVLTRFDHPLIVILGAVSILVSTLSVNVATNGVAVGYDLTSLMPTRLNFGKSALIAIIIGAISAPWLWYQEGGSFDLVMGAVGATMGPVLGVMLVDFFIIRKMNYDVDSLFIHTGQYGGWNKSAIASFVIGIVAAFIGLIIPSLSILYSFNWFIGVGIAGVTYLLLMWSKRSSSVMNTNLTEEEIANDK